LSLDVPGANTQQNFQSLDNLISPVLKKYDFTGLLAGQGISYVQPTEGMYNVAIVATSIPPLGPFSPAQVDVAVSYTDNAGPEYNDATLNVIDDGQPASINEAIFAVKIPPITVYSSYVTFGVTGALPNNAWYCPVTVTGPGAAYGATLTQSNPSGGCTARFYGVVSLGGVAGYLLYTVLTGTDDFDTTGPIFVDAVSGTQYTSTGAKAAGTFTGPGFGVNMVQFVSGAFGIEMNVPTTTMYLGPHVSGTPDLPSGFIAVAGTAPSTTQAYAWYDPVNGGVFVPSAPWTDAATRVVFPYNLHVRISLIG
jgi:hypothetical protein